MPYMKLESLKRWEVREEMCTKERTVLVTYIAEVIFFVEVFILLYKINHRL